MAKPSRPIIEDGIYFISCATHDRQPFFREPRLSRIIIDQLYYYTNKAGGELFAYAVMPDHYHAVLKPGMYTVSRFIHDLHSYTAHLINQALGYDRKTKIWTHNTWDEAIRSEEMFWQKVAYVLLNPFREGLTKSLLDNYPFSDLGEWKEKYGEEFLVDLFAKYRRSAE